jgi:hypothetical protein
MNLLHEIALKTPAATFTHITRHMVVSFAFASTEQNLNYLAKLNSPQHCHFFFFLLLLLLMLFVAVDFETVEEK